MALKEKKCFSCKGKVLPLSLKKINEMIYELNDWSLEDDRLVKYYSFKDFKETMKFMNKVASLAETENHHPDFFIESFE